MLELDADLAFAVLRDLDAEAAAWGGSVAHLVELAGFAADLVRGAACSRWCLTSRCVRSGEPVLTGPDAAWARVLAASMPPPAGGRRTRTRASPSGPTPWTPWSTRPPGRRSARLRLSLGRAGDPATRAWLAALTGAGPDLRRRPDAVAALAARARPVAGRRRRRAGPGVLPAGRAGR